jgi:hypothetical protein
LLAGLRIGGEAGTADGGLWRTLIVAVLPRWTASRATSALAEPISPYLAGKWPDAADLLYWRMNEIKLDRKEITQADPQVMRDLQRVCTVCGSKRRCKHELAKNPSDPAWQKYCPNATTLSALAAERSARAN